jgi:hypothetical protein
LEETRWIVAIQGNLEDLVSVSKIVKSFGLDVPEERFMNGELPPFALREVAAKLFTRLSVSKEETRGLFQRSVVLLGVKRTAKL